MGTKQEGQHNTVKGTGPRTGNHLAPLTGILGSTVFPCHCVRREKKVESPLLPHICEPDCKKLAQWVSHLVNISVLR